MHLSHFCDLNCLLFRIFEHRVGERVKKVGAVLLRVARLCNVPATKGFLDTALHTLGKCFFTCAFVISQERHASLFLSFGVFITFASKNASYSVAILFSVGNCNFFKSTAFNVNI